MLLIRGEDPIAAKYASNWKLNNPGELIYLVAAGMRFNCLDTVAPDVREWEVPHAAGQN